MDTADLQRVVDELAIVELTARYNYAIDEKRPDDWVATFVPDGTFDSSALGRFSGSQELQTFAQGYTAAFTGRHCTTDHIVEIDGDTARHRCYLILVNNASGSSVVSVTAVYDDQLRRTPEGWRFTYRKVTPDGAIH